MTTTVLVAVLAGVAAALLAPPGRPRAMAPPAFGAGSSATSRSGGARSLAVEDGRAAGSPDPQHPLRRRRLLLAACTGTVPLLFLGGVLGVLVALAVSAWVWWEVGHMEPPSARRRRERAARDLPHVIDLLAVVLASGASTSQALRSVASAVDPPLADELTAVERSLALGRDPVRVWQEAAARAELGALARAMVRALDTGASVADALHRLSSELQSKRHLDDEARARSVGVRVAAPLGLCLLPAFVLVGVVPLVGSTVRLLVTP